MKTTLLLICLFSLNAFSARYWNEKCAAYSDTQLKVVEEFEKDHALSYVNFMKTDAFQALIDYAKLDGEIKTQAEMNKFTTTVHEVVQLEIQRVYSKALPTSLLRRAGGANTDARWSQAKAKLLNAIDVVTRHCYSQVK